MGSGDQASGKCQRRTLTAQRHRADRFKRVGGALGDCDFCWIVRHPTPDTTQAGPERWTVTAGHTAPPAPRPGCAHAPRITGSG